MALSELKKIIKKIDDQKLISILKELILIHGYVDYPNQEKKISHHIFSIFKNEGIDVVVQEAQKNRNNVIAKLKGSKKGKSLTLNGHIDTVPPNDDMVENKPILKDGKIFGLGACDMKGAVAAMVYSMILLKRNDIRLDGDLYFTGVIGEESGGIGTDFLLKSGFKTDYFIVGEPTGLKIVNSHKGVFNMDVTIIGKAAHASIPEKGANAIEAMADFICLIKKNYLPVLQSRNQAKVGNPTISFGIIQGGKKINVVADRCVLKIDRRWIDTEKKSDLIGEIEPFLQQVCRANKNLQYSIVPTLPQDNYFGPFFLPEDNKFIQICSQALKNIDLKPEIDGMQGWTDGAAILHKGMSTLILGPGSMDVAHTAEEHIKIDELIIAAKAYLSIIFEICINSP